MCSKYVSTLTIAGSDSCGGAGLQADIKTMSALGCYACSVVTAVTAQDTTGVRSVEDMSADLVARQLRAVMCDIRPSAIKTGMLGNAEVVAAIADILSSYPRVPLVVDPIIVATSGDSLMRQGTLQVLVDRLIPLASLLTPNLPEAETLAGMNIRSTGDIHMAARHILDMGCQAVLIKGGHADGKTKTDWLFTQTGMVKSFSAQTITTSNTHGTGCTLSAAITAYLARGLDLVCAVDKGKRYLSQAIKAGAEVTTGHGHGPLNHFFHPQKLIIQP